MTGHLLCLIGVISAQVILADQKGSVLSSANNDFTKDVFKNLLSSEQKNTIVSPFSIHVIMGLVSYGADKETKTAMTQGLHISHSDDLLKDYSKTMEELNQSPELKVVDKVYMAKDLKINPAFKEIAVKHFKSDIASVDFSKTAAAVKEMNTWVEDSTNHKIKDLIKPDAIDGQTRMVLINAVHFKDQWSSQFEKHLTRDEPFYTDEKNSFNVPTMHQTDDFRYYEEQGNEGFQVLELPYASRGVSMHIFLPNKKGNLAGLEKKLFQSEISFSEKFKKIIAESSIKNVEVSLPKFKIESSWDLKEFCEKSGMGVIFSDKANFNAITENKEALRVSKVIQKAVIEVDEYGTEAAAATAIQLMLMSYVPPSTDKVTFKADHPFVYVLRSKSNNAILFMGTVLNPQK